MRGGLIGMHQQSDVISAQHTRRVGFSELAERDQPFGDPSVSPSVLGRGTRVLTDPHRRIATLISAHRAPQVRGSRDVRGQRVELVPQNRYRFERRQNIDMSGRDCGHTTCPIKGLGNISDRLFKRDFHVATNTPPKSELIAPWLPQQSWGPDAEVDIELLGGFHLDDPEGEVGIQVFIVKAADSLFQVPLTYRARPLDEADHALLGNMQHSTLGIRYVYDGLADERFVAVLAGVAASGYGQTLGFVHHDDRWHAWPEQVRLHGYGSMAGRVPVDRFAPVASEPDQVTMRNDALELTVFRCLAERPLPHIGLAATWPGQSSPVSLAEIEPVSQSNG